MSSTEKGEREKLQAEIVEYVKTEFPSNSVKYLGYLNKKPTAMLMHGDKFSVIPITPHINVKNIYKYINSKYLKSYLKNVFYNLNKIKKKINFNKIKF